MRESMECIELRKAFPREVVHLPAVRGEEQEGVS